MARNITYKGIKYPSIKSCVEANAIEGLSYASVQARLKMGWTLEEALTVPEKHRKAHTIDGVTYPSIVQMCRSHNVKIVTYRRRIKSGWSIEEAIGIKQRVDGRKNKKGNSYTINNKTYRSVYELSREFNVNEGTIRDRLKKGFSPEVAVGISPMPKRAIHRPKYRTYEFNNKTYKALREIAEITGIKERTLWARINVTKMSVEDAVNFEPSGNRVVCHGQLYLSIAALAKAYNLPRWKVHQRIYNSGFTPEEAVFNGDKRLA